MAIRHYWFVFSAAVSVGVATQTPLIVSAIVNLASDSRMAAAYAALFDTQPVLWTGAGVAIAALLLFLLYYAGLSLVDGIHMASAHRRLNVQYEEGADLPAEDFSQMMEDYPSLDAVTGAFVRELTEIPDGPSRGKSRHTHIASGRPANFFYGPQKILHPRLLRWFFDPLPLFLLSIGSALLMLLAIGAVGPQGTIPLGSALEPGIVSLFVLATAALLIYVLKRIVLGIRYQQTARFCELMNALYPPIGEVEKFNHFDFAEKESTKAVVSAVSGLSKDLAKTADSKLKDWQKTVEAGHAALTTAVVASLEDALKEPLNALTEASQHSAEQVSQQSKEALDAVLNAFLDGLNKNFTKQMKDLNSVLEQTGKAAGDMKEAYRDSLEKHQKAVAESLSAYAGSFSQTAANFESLQGAVDNLLTLTAPLLRQMISHQEALLGALEQESASSKIIGRAAGELSQAAQASRDTVEQFVTLAERLREASKAIGNSAGTATSARPGPDRKLVQQLRALKSTPDNESV